MASRTAKLALMLCMIVVLTCVSLQYKDDIASLFIKASSGRERFPNTYNKNISYLPDDKVTFEHEYDPQKNEGKILGDIMDIIKRGELIVCAKKDDHNIFFQTKIENGKYVGKDIDFAKQMAATLGVKLTYRMAYGTHDEVVNAISRGEGDVGIAELSYTPARSRMFIYSTQYIIPKKMLLIDRVFLEQKEGKTLNQLLNNKNVTICAEEDTSYETFEKEIFPNAKLFSQPHLEEKIFELVEQRKVIATMRDDIRIKFLIKKYPDLLIMVMPIVIGNEEDPISVVVNFNSVQFLLWINKFIEDEAKVDTADSIVEKYGEYVR